jgi:hypothetical protein
VTFAPARPLPFSSVTVPEMDYAMAKERLRIKKIPMDFFIVCSFGFVLWNVLTYVNMVNI